MGDRIKFRINQDFADFSDFIRKIPQDDYPVDKIFCCNRNTVEDDGERAVFRGQEIQAPYPFQLLHVYLFPQE